MAFVDQQCPWRGPHGGRDEGEPRGAVMRSVWWRTLGGAALAWLVIGIVACGTSDENPPDEGDTDWRTSSRTDVGCDGTFDQCSLTRERNGATASGTDQDCDGVPESCSTSYHDDEGRFLGSDEDEDCDGVPESCVRSTAFDGTSATEQQLDEGCDGTPDLCHLSSYGADGFTSWQAFDTDCDGTPDEQCAQWLTEPDGTSVLMVDRYCDETDLSCQNSRHSSGEATWENWNDDGCDGTRDSGCATTWTDVDGNVTKHFSDRDCDGAPEYCTYWTRLGSVTIQRTEAACDGVGTCHVYTFDDAGNQVLEEEDADCDGIPELTCRSETYDAQGNRTRSTDTGACYPNDERCVEYFPEP